MGRKKGGKDKSPSLRFRGVKRQSRELVTRRVRLGTPRHGHSGEPVIHSVGTARSYEGAIRQFGLWLQNGKQKAISSATEDDVREYLGQRASKVGQSALDLDRQAIQCVLGISVERVRSIYSGGRRLAEEPRAYTADQVDLIARHMSEAMAISTRVAYAAGLRAHEIYTLRPREERAPSSHRDWSPLRFAGRSGELFTVVGKGGLVREVLIPSVLAGELERRRVEPRRVVDRGVNYESVYAVPGGMPWSLEFGRVSRRLLGWSTGAHGLRHSYAQLRLMELLRAGYTYSVALGIVAQELGHFRPDITMEYLR